MRYLVKNLLIISSILLVVSCQENTIIGSWQLYENGYSPGDKYIVEQVPEEPAQIITFKSDGSFTSNLDDLKKFKYYLIIEDQTNGEEVLALFEQDPGKTARAVSELENVYNVHFKSGLRLSNRGCIEGCHLGFKRFF